MTGRAGFCGHNKRRGAPSSGKAWGTGIAQVGVAACLVFFFLMTAGTLFASTPSAEEILRRVGQVYGGLENYHVVAVREIRLRRFHGRVLRRSVITLDAASPRRVRMVLSGGGAKVARVSDGET